MAKRAVVILAAGEGTRMRSRLPKVLQPVAGRPLVAYALELAKALKAAPVIVVVPPRAELLRRYLSEQYPDAILAVQKEPRGTAHAVLAAKSALAGFSGDVLILCGDVPLLSKTVVADFYEDFRRGQFDFSLLSAEREDPFGYGRVVRDTGGRFAKIAEERDASREERAISEINGGVYWARSECLFPGLRKVSNRNQKKEFYLTDLPAILAAEGRSVGIYKSDDARSLQGVNTLKELAEAAKQVFRQTAEAWMARGVRVEDPEHTYMESAVICEPDAAIQPGVHLCGATRIGEGSKIGVGSVLTDVKVGKGAEILPYCVISDSALGDGVHVGPFAHLRPGSRLEAGAKVGNFVELKKSRVGRGAKVNHLSYIGDALVGEAANIGAGTITCNYDGEKKWETRIGAHAFIGSNSSLIAPVSIGKGSVVGAGSAISKSVPDGALALTRAPQKIIPNWEKRRRKRK